MQWSGYLTVCIDSFPNGKNSPSHPVAKKHQNRPPMAAHHHASDVDDDGMHAGVAVTGPGAEELSGVMPSNDVAKAAPAETTCIICGGDNMDKKTKVERARATRE